MNKRLAEEEYREWLIDMVRPHTVILISARPVRWQAATLARIKERTGWQPDAAYFAPEGWWNPPVIKNHLMESRVFPEYGREAKYLAIESNPQTRGMYDKFGIPSVWVGDYGTSLRGPTGPLTCLPSLT